MRNTCEIVHSCGFKPHFFGCVGYIPCGFKPHFGGCVGYIRQRVEQNQIYKTKPPGVLAKANSPAHAPRIGRRPIAARPPSSGRRSRKKTQLLQRDTRVTVARVSNLCTALRRRHRGIATNRLRIRQIVTGVEAAPGWIRRCRR